MNSEWLGDYETEKELDNCDARSELPHAPAGIWALPAVPLRPSRARSPLAAWHNVALRGSGLSAQRPSRRAGLYCAATEGHHDLAPAPPVCRANRTLHVDAIGR